MEKKTDIKSLDLEELNTLVLSLGEKKFRAKQIYTWIHNKMVNSFDEMTNLPKNLISILKEKYDLNIFNEIECLTSKEDETKKYLFGLYDFQGIETVLMRYKYGYTVCISSQAGCKMGCKFCASTIGGLSRNLTVSEMLEQVYYIERNNNIKISNIVVMGTGEPFDNYENLLKFIKIINSKEGRNIGARNITVSTCGLIPKIIDFANENLQVNLAISLHAPNDNIRQKIMPIANKYSITDLIDSCRYYINKTNRRITFEYSLINGLNDEDEQAIELSNLLKGMLCHVNLIPINPIENRNYKKSDLIKINKFKKILEHNNIQTTIRRSLGTDINGACGQLRRKYKENNI